MSQALSKKLTPQEEALAIAVDGSLVAQQLVESYDTFCKELELSTKETTAGTSNRLKHLTTAMEMRFKLIESLQSLGLLPKNLGNSTKTEFVFKAHVGKGGSVNTSPVTTEQAVEIERAEFAALPTTTPEDQAIVDALEQEFTREGN
jgi:hypothetical protein